MIRFASAKLLLLISASAWGVSSFEPNLECGVYRARGTFGRNGQGDFTLTLNKRGTAPIQVLVLGGGIRDKTEHLRDTVDVELYVPTPIKNNDRPITFFQRFLDDDGGRHADEIALVQKEKCGIESRYLGAH